MEYDQNRAVVIARGRVEAWQGNRVVRADEFTYDRNTGVATARGNVQLIEADGQVIFADSVVLENQFRDGVIEGLRGLLAQNGRVAANSARRKERFVTEGFECNIGLLPKDFSNARIFPGLSSGQAGSEWSSDVDTGVIVNQKTVLTPVSAASLTR